MQFQEQAQLLINAFTENFAQFIFEHTCCLHASVFLSIPNLLQLFFIKLQLLLLTSMILIAHKKFIWLIILQFCFQLLFENFINSAFLLNSFIYI